MRYLGMRKSGSAGDRPGAGKTPSLFGAGLAGLIIVLSFPFLGGHPAGAPDSTSQARRGFPERNAAEFSSLNEAVAAVGAIPASIVVAGGLAASTVTVPKTLSLRFVPGGYLRIGAGQTVTLKGSVSAGRFRIFDCPGTSRVVFDPSAVEYFCPEWWGAEGNGVTDDGPAFRSMFATLTAMGAGGFGARVVTLRPSVYHRIASAHDATDVFYLDIPNLQMIGPGMDRLTFKYEGTAPRAHFFRFANTSHWVHLQDMLIEGSRTLIDTIVYWTGGGSSDQYLNTVERVCAADARTTCFSGSVWMTKYDHCEAMNAPTGFDRGITSLTYSHCYANHCAVGFNLGGNYSLLLNCACDHATTAAYKISTTGLAGQHHTLVECACEDAEMGIAAAAVDGPIVVVGGNYSGGGTTAPEFMLFDDAYFHLIGPTINAPNTYLLRFNSGGYTASRQPTITAEIDPARIYGYLSENADSPVLLREASHRSRIVSPGTLAALQTACRSLSSSTFRKGTSVLFADAAPTFRSPVELKWIRANGEILFWMDALSSAITLAPASGPGMSFDSIDGTVVFRNYHFKYAGAGATMFKIRGCRKIKFMECKLETTVAETVVFDLDEVGDAEIEIDKATMDRLTASGRGSWARLVGPGRGSRPRITFTGYSDKPAAGYFDAGDRILFLGLAKGRWSGAICTAAGSPGTWKYVGASE